MNPMLHFHDLFVVRKLNVGMEFLTSLSPLGVDIKFHLYPFQQHGRYSVCPLRLRVQQIFPVSQALRGQGPAAIMQGPSFTSYPLRKLQQRLQSQASWQEEIYISDRDPSTLTSAYFTGFVISSFIGSIRMVYVTVLLLCHVFHTHW